MLALGMQCVRRVRTFVRMYGRVKLFGNKWLDREAPATHIFPVPTRSQWRSQGRGGPPPEKKRKMRERKQKK